MFRDSWAISWAFSCVCFRRARAEARAYMEPEPTERRPSSEAMTSPLPANTIKQGNSNSFFCRILPDNVFVEFRDDLPRS